MHPFYTPVNVQVIGLTLQVDLALYAPFMCRFYSYWTLYGNYMDSSFAIVTVDTFDQILEYILKEDDQVLV